MGDGVRVLRALSLVVAIVAVLATAAPAGAAKITSQDVFGATLALGGGQVGDGQFGGAYVACDAGQRALTGGAYWHGTGMTPAPTDADEGYLANSSVTADDKGWYADGFHRFAPKPLDLSIGALCVPKADLKKSKLRQRTVKAEDFSGAKAKARCPDGARVHTGGAFFHAKGEGPVPADGGDSRTSVSFPTPDGKAWFGGGTSGFAEDGRLTVFARCLPKSKLAPVRVVKNTQVLDDSAEGGGYTACAGGRAALTGGVSWHRKGKPVESLSRAGVVSSSSVTNDGAGWYTAGQSAGDGRRLTTIVHCIR